MDLIKDIVHKYKVELDGSYEIEDDQETKAEKWRYYEIHGNRGMIFPFGKGQLAVTFLTKTTANKLRTRNGWKVIQNGDSETTCLFPTSDFYLVCKAIQAKRYRILTEQHKQKVKSALLKYRFQAKDQSFQ